LARAIRETLAAGRRVFLAVSRLTSALACDECGTVVRCAQCMLALAYSRATAKLACRLCGRTEPLPDTCPSCHGRRLSPFGWGVERVEHAVRRRFPDARIARYDPDALRGARGETQRKAAAAAQVVIGTRGALRLFGRAALGLDGAPGLSAGRRPTEPRAARRRERPRRAAAARRRRASGVPGSASGGPRYHRRGGRSGRMAVLRIRKYGDPELRRRAEPVGEITPEIRGIIADMIDTMYDEVGIGLAAPQVGVALRLIVVCDEEGRGAQALVDPVIAAQSGEATAEEGCLSIPGVFAPVTRSEWVKIEARDGDGR